MSAPVRGPADGPIYLDHNATTPVDPRVMEAALPYLTRHFGNPSSAHGYAEQPRAALARARGQVAALINAGSPGDVLFIGSGSEANNLAVRGAVLAAGRERAHVVTQATEHPAVLGAVHALRRLHGVRVTVLPVDSRGLVAPGDLAAACGPDTVLVTVMAANNETGALQPIGELTAIAHERGALFHSDAAQWVGKLALDGAAWEVDLLTVAGHKLYAPKGVGALYRRPGTALEPILYGGGQERGLRRARRTSRWRWRSARPPRWPPRSWPPGSRAGCAGCAIGCTVGWPSAWSSACGSMGRSVRGYRTR